MENRDGRMTLGGLDARQLVERFGSPLYVIEEDRIRENAARIKAAFNHENVRIFYAMKANPNLEILRIMEAVGLGVDCCSAGEAHLARRAGIAPHRMTFTGTAVTPPEAESLASLGLHVNFDALTQLDRYLPLFPDRRAGIRVNPGRGTGLHQSCTTGGKESKLGIPIQYASQALDIARRHGGSIAGLHVHTGSGGLDPDHFCTVARQMFDLAETFADQLDYIDLGGGIGVPHDPADRTFDLGAYAPVALGLLDDWNRRHARPLQLHIEPGQYLVSDAGWLLMTVVVRKETPEGKTFIIADSNFNHYLGTSLYESYHEFLKADDLASPPCEVVDLCGNLCNTGDTFAKDRRMPRLAEDDLLAMVNAGAYGMSRGSNYNSRPLPAEVMVSGGNAFIIRRRQSYDDLLQWQVPPLTEPDTPQA